MSLKRCSSFIKRIWSVWCLHKEHLNTQHTVRHGRDTHPPSVVEKNLEWCLKCCWQQRKYRFILNRTKVKNLFFVSLGLTTVSKKSAPQFENGFLVTDFFVNFFVVLKNKQLAPSLVSGLMNVDSICQVSAPKFSDSESWEFLANFHLRNHTLEQIYCFHTGVLLMQEMVDWKQAPIMHAESQCVLQWKRKRNPVVTSADIVEFTVSLASIFLIQKRETFFELELLFYSICRIWAMEWMTSFVFVFTRRAPPFCVPALDCIDLEIGENKRQVQNRKNSSKTNKHWKTGHRQDDCAVWNSCVFLMESVKYGEQPPEFPFAAWPLACLVPDTASYDEIV